MGDIRSMADAARSMQPLAGEKVHPDSWALCASADFCRPQASWLFAFGVIGTGLLGARWPLPLIRGPC